MNRVGRDPGQSHGEQPAKQRETGKEAGRTPSGLERFACDAGKALVSYEGHPDHGAAESPAAELPTKQLLAALRAGDEDALRELLPILRERLVSVAKRRLEGEEAEEVVQDTLTTLWQKRDSVKSGRHLLQFVFQTLRYKIGNVYRTRRRHDSTALPERAGISSGDWWQPESSARGLEFERVLDVAIARCAGENELWGRILAWLRAGHDAAEVRRLLGDVPMATAHTRIHRARARLREILRDDYGVEA